MHTKEFEKAIKVICKMLYYGLWELRVGKNLLLIIVLTIVGLLLFYILWDIWWLGFVFTALFTMCIGYSRCSEVDRFSKIFYDVGFLGKDKKAPLHLRTQKNGERTIYTFKSNIPISIWEKRKEDIQTAIDCRIISIQQGKNSKKVVDLVTVLSSYKLPTMIPWKAEYINSKESVITVGESLQGKVEFDFNSTPHWILAGSTGSGKSVLLRSIVGQTLIKKHRVYLMDFKRGVEFGSAYDKFCEVIMTKERAVELLEYLVEENKRRLDIFRSLAIKDIRDYAKIHPDDANMYRIVTFILFKL